MIEGIVGIVDYEAGNLRSVERALRRVGANFLVSADPEKLFTLDKLIFPGVGEASSAMKKLEASGLDRMLKEFFASGKPILGICLGSQIILDRSEEGPTNCLGLIPGEAKEFKASLGLKIPHMGFNDIREVKRTKLLSGIRSGSSFYFVHSYYPEPSHGEDVYAVTEYGIEFPSIIGRDNLIACQFHPEKSGEHGLAILKNFLSKF